MAMFERSIVTTLLERLGSERRFVQALVGPRQVGKTTAVLQAGSRLEAAGIGFVFASGDEPLLPGPARIDVQWEAARAVSSRRAGRARAGRDPQALGLGRPCQGELGQGHAERHGRAARGAGLLAAARRPASGRITRGAVRAHPGDALAMGRVPRGLRLGRRYLRLPRRLPRGGAARGDFARWRRYVLDALIETTVSRDVLSLGRIEKPALLRQLFYLTVTSGQVVAYSSARRTTRAPRPVQIPRLLEDGGSRADVSGRCAEARLETEAPDLERSHGAARGISLDEALARANTGAGWWRRRSDCVPARPSRSRPIGWVLEASPRGDNA